MVSVKQFNLVGSASSNYQIGLSEVHTLSQHLFPSIDDEQMS